MPAMWRVPYVLHPGVWERFGISGEYAPDGWLALEGWRFHSIAEVPE